MNKGLEAYEIVKEECGFAFGQTANGDRVRENLPIIEKELKVLEIIKKKKVNCSHLLGETLDYYNSMWNFDGGEKYQLTQEEYDLLQEVLL